MMRDPLSTFVTSSLIIDPASFVDLCVGGCGSVPVNSLGTAGLALED